MIRHIFLSIAALLFSSPLISQTAIRGILYDNTNGEPIPFADVVIQGTQNGTTTDLDGSYQINVTPGTYALYFSYLGYAELVISDIEVVKDQITVIDAKISEDSEQLTEIVVTAKQVRNTESAVLTLQKKSVNFIDGLSSQTFDKTGDGNAAAAIKRVPGVSVEDGKHVYVRGLGDRYTKTILNGVDIPGLDPDKNTVQMDIFPTNIIDNIIVYKTFTSDLSGDFTGGLVEILTKDFPEQATTQLSASLSYTPSVHFNNSFVTYEGGQHDWLGMDDGTRELPFNKRSVIPDNTANDIVLSDITKMFNPVLGVKTESQFLNQNLGFSTGNQHALKKAKFGYNFAINYSSEHSFDDATAFGTYIKAPDASVNELGRLAQSVGQKSISSNLWSGLLGTSIKFDKHKIGISVMRSQGGESSAAKMRKTDSDANDVTLYRDILQYSERSVTNLLLSGKHVVVANKLTIDWKASPTYSRINEPDIRATSFEELEDGTFQINPAVGATSERAWRTLKEDNYSAKLNISYNFKGFKELNSKLKTGFSYTIKSRQYEINSYNLRLENQSTLNITGNANELLETKNIWLPETRTGSYYIGNHEPANVYDADNSVMAAYLMNELSISRKLKAIYGARFEKATINFTGQDNSGEKSFQDVRVFDEVDLLPSLSFIYKLGAEMNLRASYSQTLARPTFKEKSLVQIFDLISGTRFIGNLGLQESHIKNYDIRWEYFLNTGQVISVSGFYKSFKDPIELVVFDEFSPNDFQPRNVGQAEIMGVEVEGRKNLGFIGMPHFSIQANVAVIASSVEMDADERDSRSSIAREGEETSHSRDMFGQSPYIVNAALNFQRPERGWDANVSFNIQGERLSLVGLGRNPDVYEQPFESLNVKVSKHMGERLRLSLAASNLLDSNREFLYKSYKATDRLFSRFSPGRTLSFGLSYRLK